VPDEDGLPIGSVSTGSADGTIPPILTGAARRGAVAGSDGSDAAPDHHVGGARTPS
jgi:hypothetical protein